MLLRLADELPEPVPDEQPEGGDEEGKDKRRPPLYIHLRDARFVAPGSAPISNNRGVLWRGTINSVSGLSLGALAEGTGDETA